MEGVLEQNRVGTAALQERPELRVVAPYEITQPDALVSADSLVDRSHIEGLAHELIAARDCVETQYKTKTTYRDDSRTLLFEALTASGHLSTTEISGSLEEIHHTMLKVLLNAYSDTLPEHEKRRRFQEICEELTRQDVERRIAAGEVSAATQVAIISDYVAEGALSEKSAISIGYRPKNKKGMIRSSFLRDNNDGTFTRVTEQTSRSNAQALETRQFLENSNVPVRMSRHADIAVLATPFLHSSEDGVVGLHRRLDQHKGAGIRHGEAQHSEQLAYEELRSESHRREHAAECYIDKLAVYTEKLDIALQHGEITKKQHNALLKKQIHKILQSICVMDPSYAKDCFGEAVVDSYHQASDRAAGGDYSGAAQIVSSSQHQEQTVSFCGMSISQEQAKEMGIDVDTLGGLIKFGIEKWNYTRGLCRVSECPTRPGKTDVGPCSVCRGCQYEFDNGRNPAAVYRRRMKKMGKKIIQKAVTFWNLLGAEEKAKSPFQLFEFKKPKKMQNKQKHERIAA